MKSQIASLTIKGQITIPMMVRNKMKLSAGSKLEFISCDGYIMLVPVTKSVSRLQGILSKPLKAISCEEIDNIIKGGYDRN